MLGKIVNGRLQIAGNIVTDGTKTITSPTEEQLIALGYKVVEYTERPTYNEEEEKLQETYTDGETIVVSYEKINLTDEEHNAIIQQKIQQEFGKVTVEDLIDLYDGKKDATSKINEIKSNVAKLREKLREDKDEK